MFSLHNARPSDARITLVFALLTLAIVAVNAVVLSRYSAWAGQAAPEWPVAIDLLVVVPLLYLALFFRRGWAALWRAAALVGLGVLIGSFIIPQESKRLWLLLEPLRYVVLGGVLLAQVGVALFVLRQIFAARHAQNLELALDHAIAKHVAQEGIGSLIRLEARVWLYGLLRRPVRQPFPGERHFHVSKQGMNASNQQGFLILIGAEIPIAHFLIALFDPLIAAVVSALSVYGFMFMLAEYRATLHRPISVDVDGMHIRYGVVTDLQLPWNAVVSAAPFKGSLRRTKGQLRLIGMGEANVMLELAPGTRLGSLLGTRETQRIYLGVDDAAGFLAEVRSRMSGTVVND
ncbi:MAG: hypothetical protein ACT4NL_01420 [Pseudomarimonas sp.]